MNLNGGDFSCVFSGPKRDLQKALNLTSCVALNSCTHIYIYMENCILKYIKHICRIQYTPLPTNLPSFIIIYNTLFFEGMAACGSTINMYRLTHTPTSTLCTLSFLPASSMQSSTSIKHLSPATSCASSFICDCSPLQYVQDQNAKKASRRPLPPATPQKKEK